MEVYAEGFPQGVYSPQYQAQIFRSFSAYGSVDSVTLMPNERCMGAIVKFKSAADAAWVVENVNGNIPSGFQSPVLVRSHQTVPGLGKTSPNAGTDRFSPYGAPPQQMGMTNSAMPAAGNGMRPAPHQQSAGPSMPIPPPMMQNQMATSQAPPMMQNQMATSQASNAPLGTLYDDNLYIEGLPTGTDENKLREVFTSYGDVVRCKLLVNSKGLCGLVNFKDIDDAQWVVDNVHGNIPNGLQTPVQVRFVNPGKDRPGSMASQVGMPSQPLPPPGPNPQYMQNPDPNWQDHMQSGKAPGMRATAPPANWDKVNIYIQGLPMYFDEDKLKKIFSAYGTVHRCKVVVMEEKKNTVAFVRYAKPEDAQWVVENVSGNVPEGLHTPVTVRYADPKPKGDKGGGKGEQKGQQEDQQYE